VKDEGIEVEGGLRTKAEQEVRRELAEAFLRCPDDVETKLENFPKYVRRQNLTRFLAQYELYKRILNVKGSIIERGVFRGGGIMAWAKLGAILEPVNLTRRIYGFDAFEAFPATHHKDRASSSKTRVGDLRSDSLEELNELVRIYDKNRYLSHIGKVKLIKGNATETIPRFVQENKHLVVSLLFLDFDLYEPTKVAIESFLPRMPKGAIVAFDELDNPIWPGETLAALETVGINRLRLERFEFDSYIGYAAID